VTSIVLGAMVGAGAAYALLRAVLLRREIERLIEMEASPRSDTTSW
jgi:hypothetical protein